MQQEFYKKRVVVMGLGVSGLWTARWLTDQGALVTGSDVNAEADLDPLILEELRERGVELETGGHREETFETAEMIIISPGVPLDLPVIGNAMKRGVKVTGELELASRLIETPLIAVTGTNGKSTVTEFLGLLLKKAGHDVFVGGNIGTPLMAYAAGQRNADYVVVEVSSFQLDTIERFSPYLAMILNISPDHLDRYPNYESYVRSKLKIFRNQGPGQFLILNNEDKRLSSLDPISGPGVYRYGMKKKEGLHAFIENGKAVADLEGGQRNAFPLQSFGLPGSHNLENLLALVLSGLILGIDAPTIQKTIDAFRGLPNRLERVQELDGVLFYNDSKATNVDAAVKAIVSFDRPLILIAGGRHKGADYAPLVRASKGKAKSAVFLGEAKGLLAASFENSISFSTAEDMTEAVSLSFSEAERGDIVLLAPACASFDMFSDYSHRGRAFRAAVERLANGR
ncbi:MAG: UDP-N-acetylmuramoyl-L-alanine--D-glutamate ligase [Deltaproteobacteria bacterium]|nr:UDP-N-acetylmuramoyl-L-alanine--D-glutamate ligase [Deltaproteobacteria bacterium]